MSLCKANVESVVNRVRELTASDGMRGVGSADGVYANDEDRDGARPGQVGGGSDSCDGIHESVETLGMHGLTKQCEEKTRDGEDWLRRRNETLVE